MSTFWIGYFQIWGKSLKSFPRVWWALFRSSSTPKWICSPMQCFFCKLVQMSNFNRLNSQNEQILERLFPNLRQIPQIHLAYVVSIIYEAPLPPKRFALQCSAFSVNRCKCPILIGKIQQISTFWIGYFQICGKSPKSIWRIWWELFRTSNPPKIIALQCSAFSVNWCKWPILIG